MCVSEQEHRTSTRQLLSSVEKLTIVGFVHRSYPYLSPNEQCIAEMFPLFSQHGKCIIFLYIKKGIGLAGALCHFEMAVDLLYVLCNTDAIYPLDSLCLTFPEKILLVARMNERIFPSPIHK